MRLGTETASLTNHILSRAVIGQPEPVEGMGATILCWSDRHAATIVSTWEERGSTFILAQEDKAIVVGGSTHNGTAEYRYERDPNGAEHVYRRERSGQWQAVYFNATTRRWRKVEGNGLRIGERAEYRDPCF